MKTTAEGVTKSVGSSFQSIANTGESAFNLMTDSIVAAAKTTVSTVETVFSAVSGVGESAFKVFTAGSAALGGVGVAAFKNIVETGGSIEAQLSKVEAISGADAEQMELLTDKAVEMGAKTQFSITEAGQAFEYMAMAGWKTDQMLGGIEGIMNLAAASGEDLGTTSDIVTDALTAFKLSAEDAGHFADVLATASSNANTKVSEMGDTFKYAAPLAGAAGFSIEDTALAVGLMANSSVKGAMAGTSLRSMITRLVKPTKESAQAMEALNLSVTDSEGNIRSLGDIIDDIRTGFSKMTAEERTSNAAMLAGQEAVAGLLAIINASDEDYQKLKTAIYDADGAAQSMAETMVDNLPGAITMFKSAAEAFKFIIYQDMQTPLKELVQDAQKTLVDLTGAYSLYGFEGLVNKAGELAGNGILNALELMPDLLDEANEAEGSLLSGIGDFLIGNSGAISKGITRGSAGIRRMFKTFVAEAKPVVRRYSGEIVTEFLNFKTDFFTAGSDLITSFVEGVADDKGKLESTVESSITKITGSVNKNLPKIVKSGGEIVGAWSQGVKDSLPEIEETADLIAGYLEAGVLKAFENLPGAIETAGEVIDSGYSRISGFLTGNSETISGGITKGSEGVRGIFKSFIENAKPVVQEYSGELVTEFLNFKTDFFTAGSDLITSFVNGIADDKDQIKTTVKDSITKITDNIDENLPQIVKSGGEILGSLTDGIIESLPKMGDSFENGLEVIADASENAAPKITEISTKLIEFLANDILSEKNVSNFCDAGINILSSLGNALINNLDTIGEACGTVAGTVVSKISSKIMEADWGNILGNIGDGIGSAVKSFEIASVKELYPEYADLPDELVPWEIMLDPEDVAGGGHAIAAAIREKEKAIEEYRSGEASKPGGRGGSFGETTVSTSDSAIAKVTEHIINYGIYANEYRSQNRDPIQVNVNIDGERAAETIVDNLPGVYVRRGVKSNELLTAN